MEDEIFFKHVIPAQIRFSDVDQLIQCISLYMTLQRLLILKMCSAICMIGISLRS